MPEEGLSKQQRRQLAQMEYAKKMQAKDKEVSRCHRLCLSPGQMEFGGGREGN